jgi:CoA:oxalate CoA-transferase
MSKAYAGLKVLDFTTTISGPHCTRLLADLGAEVIKVEAPEGDMMRMRPPLRNGASTAFGQLNAGKKSVAFDLKNPRVIDALRRLVGGVDVLVENFRPGVMARLGLDYASLSALNPRLVYCSISGYGQTGPSSQLPAYAPVIHAASGYDRAHLAYQMGRERPDYCGIFVADVGAGAYAFGAIGAALHQRAQTGQGQHIDVSMMETMLGMTLNEVQAAQFHVPPPGRPLFGPMRTADGFVMVAIASERTFQGFLAAMGRPDLEQDPRFAQYVDRRLNWGELMDVAEAWSAGLDSNACLAALDANGVPCSHYRTVAQAMADPQIEHRGALAEIHDAGGTFRMVNPPFRMSGGSTDASGGVSAKLGEHTREVLRAAGLDDADIAALGA